ncbi:MAG: ABC transporter ATP-binding protein [Clostridia bacterium]|nr:ABC transporter ATP-binding protein [Clostridia bacterium]
MKTVKANQNGKIWLKSKMRPYRASVFLLTFLTVLATVISLAFAYLVRYLINSATNGANKLLWTFSAVLLGLLLLKILLKTIDSYYAEKLRAKIIADLRAKTFSKILRSEYAQITDYHSGELLNRLTSDIAEVAVDTVGLMPSLVGMSVQCVGSVVALLTIDPLFTVLYVVCGAAFGGIAALFRKQLKKRHKEVLQADGEHRSFMQEGLTSMMTIKAYSAEEKTTDKSAVFAQEYYQKRMHRNRLRAGMNAVFNLLSNSGLIIAVIWGGLTILRDPANPDYGSVLSVILLLMQFQQPLTSFSSVIPAYYARLASGERLYELENIPLESSIEMEEAKEEFSSIAFEHVEFSYGRENIFTDANFVLKKGQVVCLTGTSGTGKSTVFKLLLQVFKQQNGNIVLQTANRKTCDLTAKERALFAYVPQGNFLFSGSIYENLAFFCDEMQLTEEKIRRALMVACAEFVYDLPEGLQTVLTERGGGLSEGQLQRLAVARAVLSDRPILLLDEATSALDNETEKRMLENIKNLQDKTCLIVTHRAAALSIADEVWSVENNTINKI